ncbi:MAG: hypothetical protein ACRC6U_10010, partial [Fusobacteriaceae bacterium]
GSNLKLKTMFSAIYLGSNISSDDEELITYIALKKGIKKIYKFKRSNIQYKLNKEKINLKEKVLDSQKIEHILEKKFGGKEELKELKQLISDLDPENRIAQPFWTLDI